MVLDETVEERFACIEREYSARERLAKHGLRYTRRVLLYGPPGCGKTLVGESTAGELSALATAIGRLQDNKTLKIEFVLPDQTDTK